VQLTGVAQQLTDDPVELPIVPDSQDDDIRLVCDSNESVPRTPNATNSSTASGPASNTIEAWFRRMDAAMAAPISPIPTIPTTVLSGIAGSRIEPPSHLSNLLQSALSNARTRPC
jgi:hypothetical protein